MRTYKMTIVYEGSKYLGWQRQNNTDQTIQETVEDAIGQITGRKVAINGSGRTDSGVHAKGQTATMMLSGKVEEAGFKDSLNRQLPEDIRVKEMTLVKNGFHARLNAKGKCYEYLLDTREKPDVFTRKYCHHFPYKLNVKAMKEAAGYLEGKHDFSSFTDKRDEKSTIRTIYDIIIEKQGSKIRIEYHGTGFLYHMVRILTGTLMDVGTGKLQPEELAAILEGKRRERAGFLAPAKGLFLKEVYYS